MPSALHGSALLVALATGSGLALTSVAHCAVMCGPLATSSRARGGPQAAVTYYLGRLVTYGALGAIAGSLGRLVLESAWTRAAEAALSWVLAATLLFSALRMLRGPSKNGELVTLGRAPRRSRLGRALAYVAGDPLLLGVATALLPCGVLYTAFAASAAQGHPLLGAIAMGSFAAISGLGVLGFAELFGALARGSRLRWIAGGALLAGSLLFAYRPLPLLRAEPGAVPACHAHAAPEASTR